MTHSVFVVNAKLIVENYWRIKAALKILKPSDFNGLNRLVYVNVPQLGQINTLHRDESIADAINSLNTYATDRLTKDTFTVLISEFESRLNSFLLSASQNPGGTLGAIQRKVEAVSSLPTQIIEDIDEIRERRNALAHSQGIASQKYVDAAAKVAARAAPYVVHVSPGADVSPAASYLTYCANVMLDYSQQL